MTRKWKGVFRVLYNHHLIWHPEREKREGWSSRIIIKVPEKTFDCFSWVSPFGRFCYFRKISTDMNQKDFFFISSVPHILFAMLSLSRSIWTPLHFQNSSSLLNSVWSLQMTALMIRNTFRSFNLSLSLYRTTTFFNRLDYVREGIKRFSMEEGVFWKRWWCVVWRDSHIPRWLTSGDLCCAPKNFLS